MRFRDIIHFYQGCPMEIVYGKNKKKYRDALTIVSVFEDTDFEEGEIEIWGKDSECIPLKDVKLILRDFESGITDKEMEEYYKLCKKVVYTEDEDVHKTTIDTPESIAWLILNRFDIFNLKEQGHAIIDNSEKEIQEKAAKMLQKHENKTQ